MGRPRLEVADVFRRHGQEYRQRYGSSMSVEQLRAMRAIEVCRTPALGGHVDQCDHCGRQVISYNSCRNRHCPKCQNLDKALWREERLAEVLPVPYYHAVFTFPHQLAPLALQNKKAVYGVLLRAASQTLLRIAADPKHAPQACSSPTGLHLNTFPPPLAPSALNTIPIGTRQLTRFSSMDSFANARSCLARLAKE